MEIELTGTRRSVGGQGVAINGLVVCLILVALFAKDPARKVGSPSLPNASSRYF